jgi:hypothetical protein
MTLTASLLILVLLVVIAKLLADKAGSSVELACLPCLPACLVGLPALLACLPSWPGCLVGLPASLACLPAVSASCLDCAHYL